MTATPSGGLNRDAATWLAYLKRVIACAEAIAQTARIKVDEAPLLAACLLARSISTTHAVVHLMGLGHVVEARMLARSIFENEFYLYRLARDDGNAFADKMYADEIYHHRGLGQAIAATGGERASRVQEIVDWSLQNSPDAKPLTPRGAISGAEIRDIYVFYKQLSFDAGHPSITALKRHYVKSAEEFSLTPRLMDGEEEGTAGLASLALLIVCIAANDAFGRTTGGEQLDELVAEYNEIVARTPPA
jgi:hypothetical protein